MSVGDEVFQHVDPQSKCRDVYQACNFDAPDGLYGRFNRIDSTGVSNMRWSTLPNNQDFLVIAGVDHHAFADDALNTYFSYSISRYTDQVSVASFVDLDMIGSAASYLTGTGVDASRLFAMKISRSCGGAPYCLEVPWGENGVPPFNPFDVLGRIY
jgi:hypothetical protein